jgi:hypothetical protein
MSKNNELILDADYLEVLLDDIRLMGWEEEWFKITEEWLIEENYTIDEDISKLIGFEVKYKQKGFPFEAWESCEIKFTFRSPNKKITKIKAIYRGGSTGRSIIFEDYSPITIKI